MLRRALLNAFVMTSLVSMTSLLHAQVQEGTVLVHVRGDVSMGDWASSKIGSHVFVGNSSSFTADVIAVYHNSKYQSVVACDGKWADRFYQRLSQSDVILLNGGDAFATGSLHLAAESNRSLHAENIKPRVTTKINALGTTSTNVGSKHSQPPKLTSQQLADWEALARSILRDSKKIPDAELKEVEHERVTVINVDGKTPMAAGELVSRGADGIAHQLLLLAEINGSTLKPALAQYNRSKLAPFEKKFYPYIDVLDVDGDGADEIVALLSLGGKRIFHRNGSRWILTFTNDQNDGCPVAKQPHPGSPTLAAIDVSILVFQYLTL